MSLIDSPASSVSLCLVQPLLLMLSIMWCDTLAEVWLMAGRCHSLGTGCFSGCFVPVVFLGQALDDKNQMQTLALSQFRSSDWTRMSWVSIGLCSRWKVVRPDFNYAGCGLSYSFCFTPQAHIILERLLCVVTKGVLYACWLNSNISQSLNLGK